ncbi:hypothetical protein CH260_20245 [Rhodococcus sp. 05-2256-B2]|nr:hypothetical protein CH258_13775 [Rhodococcus sp. 05-2256-B4]OZD92426.1 hypothetical protein CH260_20245 [Rhodococcus sp. 05-2256-B2]OZD99348.1 hypothetical protein CH257_00855 [Rhodococcus sp. 05-2256-B3]OZE02872.1 hypothetical protein CH285_12970 [Rhodococcus sp. 05-2256-B1]
MHRPNEDRVVMIDIDGVLADLSAHAGVLADEEIDPAQRWREFFAHVPEAAVLAGGHDLAWAVHGLGYTIVYSTTRPAYALPATRAWLTDQDFPDRRAVLGRPASEYNQHTRQAWQIKLGHARAVINRHPAWLRGFVDDDPDAVRRLTSSGVRAHDAGTLTQLGVASLRDRLDNS